MTPAALVFLGLLAQPAPAVGPADAPPVSTRYVVEGWTVRDGLPQSSVTALTQDDDGFIWVATFGGVARFDGERFVRADAPRADMDGHRFTSLAHVAGAIYAGTESGRLFRFEGAPARTVSEVELGLRDPLWDLLPDPDGTLWVAAGGAGLWAVRDDRAQKVEGGPEVAFQLVHAADGALWVRGRDTLTCARGPCPAAPRLVGHTFHALARDPAGHLRAASDDGLLRVRAGRAEAVDARRYTAVQSGSGPDHLWLSTGDELHARVGDRVERVVLAARRATGRSLDDTYPQLRVLFVDRDGDLWVGSDDAGLLHLRDRHLTQIGRHAGLVGDSVSLALPARDGSAWLSSYCNGLQRWTAADGVVRVPGLSPRACVSALAEGPDGTVWLDAGGALARVREGAVALVRPGFEGTVTAMVFDGPEALWLGTRKAGVVRVETGTVVARIGAAEGLLDDTVGALLREADGTLVAGTARGLSVIEGGRARPLLEGADHRAVHVRDLAAGPGGVLWVATYGDGLARVEPARPGQPRRATWMGEVDGFCADTLSRLVIVDDHLWINSNRGVFRLPLAALDERASGGTRPLSCQPLDTGEGNGGGQMAGGRLPDGRLIFPTVDGVALVDPVRVATPPPPPAVVITSASLGGTPLVLDGDTLLPPGHDGLAIELATPHFGGLGPPTFERVLIQDGVPRVEVGTARRVDYVGLGPGAYRFEVRRRDAEGRRGPPAQLEFRIAAAYHQTALFRVVLPLLSLALIAALIRAWILTLRTRNRALEAELAERRQAEAARAERDKVYRTVFEGSPGPLFVHAASGRLVDLNPAARELVGERPAATTSDHLEPFAFVAEAQRPTYRALIDDVVADGQRRTAEVTMLDGTGRAHQVRVDGAPFELGGIRHVFVAAADVTAARDAENQRAELLEKNAASRRLEGLGRLAGGIAHDFNNVLAALMLQIDMLRGSSPYSPGADEITDEMLGAIEKGRELTRRFLVFGRGAPEVKPTVLDDALLRSEPILRRLLRPGVQLEVNTEAPGVRVLVDPVHLDQVLMNLVLNAQDALPTTGTVRVGTRVPDGLDPDPAAVTVLPRPSAAVVELWVEDDGVGMDGETIGRAFEPFFTTKTQGRGTGMGLAIVHGAATKAGAGVSVRSAPGQGTAVALQFPVMPGTSLGIASPPRGLRPPVKPGAPLLLRPDGTPRRALLCDDDRAVRHSLARLLVRRGLGEVVEAEDGARALELIRQGEFDLLITDFLMPGINGVELIRALRTLDIRVPIILISGFIGDATTTLDGLPTDVIRLQKPIEPDVLWAKVLTAIAMR